MDRQAWWITLRRSLCPGKISMYMSTPKTECVAGDLIQPYLQNRFLEMVTKGLSLPEFVVSNNSYNVLKVSYPEDWIFNCYLRYFLLC